MFVPPTKNKPDKTPMKTQQGQHPTKEAGETKTEEKEDSSKWNVLDSCCFAPYKLLFAPATTLVKVIHNKVK